MEHANTMMLSADLARTRDDVATLAALEFSHQHIGELHMLNEHTPLSIAANVLASSSIQSVLRSPSYHARGWQILDRWAFSCPEQLRKLEADGEVILLGGLLEQQEIEHQVLSSTAGLEQSSHGLAEHEVLAMHEIRTEL